MRKIIMAVIAALIALFGLFGVQIKLVSDKEVRELGLERRETVRSLSTVGAGDLRGAVHSTKGPGWTNL